MAGGSLSKCKIHILRQQAGQQVIYRKHKHHGFSSMGNQLQENGIRVIGMAEKALGPILTNVCSIISSKKINNFFPARIHTKTKHMRHDDHGDHLRITKVMKSRSKS